MIRLLPLAMVVLWSSGFVGAGLAAETAAATTTLLWRFVVPAVPLVVWAVWRRRRYGAAFIAREVVVGTLGQGLYLLGVFRAADLGVPAGTSALVASLQPPLVAVLLWWLTRDAGREGAGAGDRRQVVGLATGLVGVTLVVGGGLDTSGSATGLVWVALGMLGLSAATLVADRWPTPDGTGLLDSLAVQSVVALGFFAAVAGSTGSATPPADRDFWFAVLWLTVLAFVGGYGSYLVVLRTSGPVVASAWLYLTPATAAVWAWWMSGDPLTPRMVAGLVVAAAGVAAVVLPRRSRSASRDQPPWAVDPGREHAGPSTTSSASEEGHNRWRIAAVPTCSGPEAHGSKEPSCPSP